MRRDPDIQRLRDLESRLDGIQAAIDRLAMMLGDVDERSRTQELDVHAMREDLSGLRAAVQLPPTHGASRRARGSLRLLRP
jgi:hypothetical protein